MYGTRNRSPADAEVNEVLTAISQVSARLARKLSILAASQSEEEKHMSRKGHTAEIRELLQKYGAAKLSGINPANYRALLTDVERLSNGK